MAATSILMGLTDVFDSYYILFLTLDVLIVFAILQLTQMSIRYHLIKMFKIKRKKRLSSLTEV